jgi:hypothetical protein
MNNDEFLNDDFLKGLIGKDPLDSPSDDFVDNVMGKIRMEAVLEPEKKSVIPWLKSAWPYILASLAMIFFFATSDLPFTQFFPGKGFIHDNLVPYLGSLLGGILNLFVHSKYTLLALTILSSGGILVLLDRLFQKRTQVHHHNLML